MGKKQTAAFMLSTLVLIGVMVYLTGVQEEALERATGLFAGPTPAAAEADKGPSQTQPAQAISPETRAKAARIKTGMDRGQVERILGPPAMARTEPSDNGSEVRTAAWMEADDMITVCFRDGKVVMVVSTPLAALPAPEEPHAQEQAKDGPARAETGPGKPKPPTSLREALLDLAEKMKRRDEMMKGLLGEPSEKK